MQTNAELARESLIAMGGTAPRQPTLEVGHLRELWPRLLREEVDELEKARDLVEVADALADVLYLAYQAAASYGLPIDEVFREVHRSNMSKLLPDGSVLRREDGKVLKPEGWSPPQLAPILDASSAGSTHGSLHLPDR
jgi:predicted HAD superfamily Cof-like phosphohydrolase